MRVLHFSDLHGRAFAQAGRLLRGLAPDWVVITGDMLPDYAFRGAHGRLLGLQERFWAAHRGCFLGPGIVTTLVRGNHEAEGFADPELASRMPGGLAGRVGFLEGIPSEFGPWGFPREMDDAALLAELEAQGAPPILLSHVPPWGVLDRTHGGVHVGHRPLALRLEGAHAPRLVLCGHVHESFGHRRVGDTLVVNAAGGWALLKVHPETGEADLLDMGLLVKTGPWRKVLRVFHPFAGEGPRPA